VADRLEVLREYRVRIVPGSESSPIGPDDLGRRSKFGGVPDEVQAGGSDKLVCPQCHLKMSLVAQTASFEHNDENNPNRRDYRKQHFMFGDVGMMYVWFCFDCLVPFATMDCY